MIAPEPMPRPAIEEALQVFVIDGEIVFLGDRLGFSMTAVAAEQTGQRLAALLDKSAPGPQP